MQFRRGCTRSVGHPHGTCRGAAVGPGARAAGPVPASGSRRDGRVRARAAPLAPMRIRPAGPMIVLTNVFWLQAADYTGL